MIENFENLYFKKQEISTYFCRVFLPEKSNMGPLRKVKITIKH